MFQQRKVKLKQQRFTWKWNFWHANTKYQSHIHIEKVKCLNSGQKERFVSVFITHCHLAWCLIFAISVVKSGLINNFSIEMFIGMHTIITIVLWLYLVQLEDFSFIWRFIWRCHHYRWRTENFDLYLAFLAIKKWGFFSVLFLLWNGTSVHNGQYLAPVTLILVADRLVVNLTLPVLRT